MSKLASRKVTITNPQGLHARPAHAFVTVASGYKADVSVIRDGYAVDGKSILSLLTLGAEQGTELTLEAQGEDAERALDALETLVAKGFDEALQAGTTETRAERGAEERLPDPPD